MQLLPSCLSAPWRSFFEYCGLCFPPACEVLIQGETQMDIWLCFFKPSGDEKRAMLQQQSFFSPGTGATPSPQESTPLTKVSRPPPSQRTATLTSVLGPSWQSASSKLINTSWQSTATAGKNDCALDPVLGSSRSPSQVGTSQ